MQEHTRPTQPCRCSKSFQLAVSWLFFLNSSHIFDVIMSFGFSPSDIVSLISLTTKTYQGWRDACGEYADITGTLNSLRIALKRIETHFETKEEAGALPAGSGNARASREREELGQILGPLKGAVSELRAVVRKYKPQ